MLSSSSVVTERLGGCLVLRGLRILVKIISCRHSPTQVAETSISDLHRPAGTGDTQMVISIWRNLKTIPDNLRSGLAQSRTGKCQDWDRLLY